MTIKVHLHHSVNSIPHLLVGPGVELGHLYSDSDDLEQLHLVAKELGLKQKWFQPATTGIPHYDLWGTPLKDAKRLYQIVDDHEFWKDISDRVARAKRSSGSDNV